MFITETRQKSIILFVSLLVVLTLGAIATYSQYKVIGSHVHTKVQQQSEHIKKLFNMMLFELKEDISYQSDLRFKGEDVAKAFSQKDRKLLYSLVIDSYKNISKQNPYLKIATFRLPDGSTFLRVHKPEMYGDKLNKKRKIILDTIATKKRQYGFEVGKLKMTYRVVTPIFYKDTFIGVVEVGIEPEYITNRIEKLYEIKTALLIKKEFVSVNIEQNNMQENKNWVLARGDLLYQEKFKGLSFEIEDLHVVFNENEYHIDKDITLMNHQGEVSAKFLLAYSIEKARAEQTALIQKNLFVIVLFLTILFVVLNVGLNRLIKQIFDTQNELKKRNKELEEAQSIAKLGTWILDLKHNKLKWSDEIFNIFEIDKRNFKASYEAFLNGIHPDDRAFVNQAYSNSLETQKKYTIEHRLLMKDGRVKWVKEECDSTFDTNGDPLISIGTVQDITQEKELSLKLEMLNKNLEVLVEERTTELRQTTNDLNNYLNTIQSILIALDKDGNIELLNKEASEVLGYGYDELVGQNWFKVCLPQPEGMQEVYPYFKQIVAGVKKSPRYNENNIVTSQGERRYIAWNNAVLRDADGNITGILSAGMDITEQKKLEQKLILAKEQAEDATKAKSSFLANMSHEIRTPMNGIIGMSHLALKTKLDDKQKNYLNKINLSANTLLGIINDILDFSKIEAGKLEIDKASFDLFQVIENVVNLVELKVESKNLDVTVDYNPELGKEFYGDSLRVNQILTNLFSNAVKFTDKGEVGLLVTRVDSNKVRFEVSDTGIGLTKNQISKLFKSFTQADSSTTKKFGGTGLGLSISKQLVEMMDGTIWVESELNQGSRFIFEIELEKKDKEQAYTVFNGKKVLIVDDSQSWLNILDHLMHSFGLDVKTTSSGKEAIKLLQENKEQYDLIIVDSNMPELDGIETCKIIENEMHVDPKKIILLSAYSKESLEEGIKEAKIDYYLHKPINPSQLNDILVEVFLGKTNTSKRKVVDAEAELLQKIQTLKGSNILLAEDNEINQDIIIDLLHSNGINIDIASNGAKVVEKYKKSPTKYELILMDIQMPILDGYEATKEIRYMDKDIPIIALTANAMKDDIKKTALVGMNRHLNKPIDVEKFYETLLEYIPQKIEFKDILDKESMREKNDDLPTFTSFDKEYGLNLVMGIQSAYIQVLKGLVKYKEINFLELNDEELQRTIHSLKGLSASAGALELSENAKSIESSLDRELLPSFIVRLNKVVSEIEEKVIRKKDEVEKTTLTSEKRDELFSQLKDALGTKRIKNIKPIIQELEKYDLNKEDNKLFEDIKSLTSKFKLKDAVNLFKS